MLQSSAIVALTQKQKPARVHSTRTQVQPLSASRGKTCVGCGLVCFPFCPFGVFPFGFVVLGLWFSVKVRGPAGRPSQVSDYFHDSLQWVTNELVQGTSRLEQLTDLGFRECGASAVFVTRCLARPVHSVPSLSSTPLSRLLYSATSGLCKILRAPRM